MASAALLRPALGPIEPQVLYPLPELQARAGLGVAAFRQMRRDGLRVRYAGGRCFVKGEWFIDHVEGHGKDTK
jgi:hypothetical protein